VLVRMQATGFLLGWGLRRVIGLAIFDARIKS
jgi:hypothetical protein